METHALMTIVSEAELWRTVKLKQLWKPSSCWDGCVSVGEYLVQNSINAWFCVRVEKLCERKMSEELYPIIIIIGEAKAAAEEFSRKIKA